jgi:uncharacterized protein (TIGR03066 family)
MQSTSFNSGVNSMRWVIVCLSILCASLITAAAPVPKERAEAEKVVGTWKLVKSSNSSPNDEPVSLEMELTLNGKITLRQSTNGGPVVVYEGEYEYKVAKNEFPYWVKFPGGWKKSETLKVKKLTETELVVVDSFGVQDELERVKPKKENLKPEEKKP